jgi:sortase (surface protein transpeptidase)
MVGADGRTYQYLVTRQDVILPKPAELLKVVNAAGPITVTLVACHPPGSIRYRLAVSGRLIGVSG